MARVKSQPSEEHFGLSDRILADLHDLFSGFPEVDKVLVYGSRAQGHFKPGSDIDLAVVSEALTPERYMLLWNELEALPIAFEIDVVHWNRLSNPTLKEEIEQTGKVLYPNRSRRAAQSILAVLDFGSLRDCIYRRFHESPDQRFSDWMIKDQYRYAAYYTAMYLLQDTYESTAEVIQHGLNRNPMRQYIEIWGFLQATFIAQESIMELYTAITEQKLDCKNFPFWQELRRYRNEIAGHPANRQERYRSFFGRFDQRLEGFTYERFDANTGKIEHLHVNLESLRNGFFEQDGADALRKIIHHIDAVIRK